MVTRPLHAHASLLIVMRPSFLYACTLLLGLGTAAALTPVPPKPKSFAYADDVRNAAALTPYVVRLRTAALAKPAKGGKHLSEEQASRWPARRVARLVRAARKARLPPSQASDLVASIPTYWSRRKLRVALLLTHHFADAGVFIRMRTWASLVAACRRANELRAAEDLIARVHATGRYLNPTLYMALLSDLCAAGSTDRANELLTSMRDAGATPSNQTYTIVLSALVKHGDTDASLALARDLRELPSPCDLPLYNTMLRALLAGGADGEVRELLEEMRVAGLAPSMYTLNILLKGFSAQSLEAALEVFNAFVAAGGTPSLISYNILLAAFARQGQLTNAEALFAQLMLNAEAGLHPTMDGGVEAASEDGEVGGGAAESMLPDVYTYNAMMRASITGNKPRDALAYHRQMCAAGVSADQATLSLLAEAHVGCRTPLAAITAAKQALEDGDVTLLNDACCAKLVTACASARSARTTPRGADDRRAQAARSGLLWTLQRWLVSEGLAEEEGLAEGSGDGDDGLTTELRSVLSINGAPWTSRERCVRDIIRTLGNACDLESAKLVFEMQPLPRPPDVWSEMIRVCNQAGDVAFASTLLADSVGMPGMLGGGEEEYVEYDGDESIEDEEGGDEDVGW